MTDQNKQVDDILSGLGDLEFKEDLSKTFIAAEVLQKVNENIASMFSVVPVAIIGEDNNKTLVLVTSLLDNAKKTPILEEKIGYPIRLLFTSKDNFESGLAFHYGVKSKLVVLPYNYGAAAADDDILTDADRYDIEKPSSQLTERVNYMIRDALESGASDIHILPKDSESIVGFRIDGDLKDMSKYHPILGKKEKLKFVNKIKAMCTPALDPTNKGIEQKGRILVQWDNRNIDCRVSVQPTIRGEKVVVRLLDSAGELKTLESLGFLDDDLSVVRKKILRPRGLIVVVGPTGSGKSTTNYALVDYCWVKNPEVNVITIEDPPEKDVPHYAQVLVKTPDDFNSALENALRQDPDIILLGEIRNNDTAKTAVRASLTGHKVFTTLHTDDCVSAISRMLDMGVDRGLLLGELRGIVSQRLLKVNCPDCSKSYNPSDDALSRLTEEEVKYILTGTPKAGIGCKSCKFKGYVGREAIGEFLWFDTEMRDFFMQQRAVKETLEFLDRRGFRHMWGKGLELVRAGKLSLENMVKVMSEND